ncbi:RHS repeat domain-containing protein [Pirellulaceae bacterium SH467]
MLEKAPELCSARPRTGEPNATFGCTEASTLAWPCFHVHSIHASVGPSPDEATTATWHYQRNQQYSITAVTTSSGSVLSSSAINNRYTYTGREWDQTLGLYHFRARWMSGIAGRFMGRDPIGYRDDANLTRFVRNATFVGADPYGLSAERPGDDDAKANANSVTNPTSPTGYTEVPCASFSNLEARTWCSKYGGISTRPRCYRSIANQVNPYAPPLPILVWVVCKEHTCNNGEYVNPQTKVHGYCDYPHSCTEIDCTKCPDRELLESEPAAWARRCRTISSLIKTGRKCLKSRNDLQTQCFGGVTDAGHAQAIADAKASVNYCKQKHQQCGCWGADIEALPKVLPIR